MLIEHYNHSFFRHRPSLLIIAITLIVTALTFIKMRELENLRLQNDFEQISKNIVTRLKDSLESNLSVLDDVGGFYSASEFVARGEFKQFTKYIFLRRNDIYMLSWSPRMRLDEIETLRQSAATDGLPAFSVTQYDHRGLIVPALKRDEYYPIFYVEPFDQNKDILGLDQASYSITQTAINKALQTGRPASTIVMSLPQFEKEPPASRNGIQVFAPIYKNHASLETPEDRKKNLDGFVVVAFHIRRMLESVFKNMNSTDLEMRIFAQGIRDKEKLIYTYNPQSIEKLKHSWKTKSEVNVAGHIWTIICSSTPSFRKSNYRWEAPVVFIVGILLGFLLAIYIFSFERSRIQKIMVALSLTDELTKLYNRRGLWLLADEQVRLSLRSKRGFWLLVMDLDHLKKINDTYGHPEGDAALQRTARLLQSTFRKSDIISRIGGDEFAVVAIETIPLSLAPLLEHIQAQLKTENASKEFFYKLDISIGAAYFDPNNPCTFEDLMAKADRELYAQKKLRQAQSSSNTSLP